jgi:CheY-like chemotaxis protein
MAVTDARTPEILVVDDDLDCRVLLATILTVEGYATFTATNGAEALALARKHHPDLILLDLMMPVMDGMTFRREQQRDPSIADIPVLCVSAMHDCEAVASRLGLDCISKPIVFADLLATIEGRIRRRSSAAS